MLDTNLQKTKELLLAYQHFVNTIDDMATDNTARYVKMLKARINGINTRYDIKDKRNKGISFDAI